MAKYIQEFTTEAAYNTARTNNYIEPWTSLTDSTGDLNYNKSEYEKLLETPLTTIAKEDGTISFNIWKSMGTDMITSVSYSTDGGETWTTTNNTNNKSEHLVIAVNVNEGDRVMWKANAQQTGYYDENEEYDGYVGSFFSSTCEFDVEGNVMSMINDATGLTYSGQLCCLFYNYDEETECLVVDASKLLLPATTLDIYCYYMMFQECTRLATAPELPATTLASNCYGGMFAGCTSLVQTPELPANTLADYCYYYMFSNCTSLTTAPVLPATTLASNCYNYMFSNCTNLTTAPVLPATALTEFCYYGMFNGCTNLTTAPELPATTLASQCYQDMFANCTSLTTAPVLPATTLATYCYYDMFYSCTSLIQAPELPSTTLASGCYEGMFRGCTALGQAPELPSTTLASRCYHSMFSGCTSLDYIKCLATNISASNCTQNWVSGVASSGTFIGDPNSTWTIGNNGIPSGWNYNNVNILFT